MDGDWKAYSVKENDAAGYAGGRVAGVTTENIVIDSKLG
jgi:hypothetical protein